MRAPLVFRMAANLGRICRSSHPLPYLSLSITSQVQGLESCEFLNKLDLTVNFVDLDELESSITAMEGNRHLGDLYMMGNPCQVPRLTSHPPSGTNPCCPGNSTSLKNIPVI